MSLASVALFLLCGQQISSSWSYSYEKILYRKLLDGYEILERPVENYSSPVKVKMGLLLQQIIDVDEKNQIIETNIWQQLQWHDYRLRWDPASFGGVTDLRFPVGKIWKPDVLLYNSVDRNFDSTYPSNMVVDHQGNVDWIPPSIVRISCNIDITWFPFDDQSCYFKFGSWSYNNAKLDLQIHERALDTSEYMQNGEWTLLETPTLRQEKAYAGPDDIYAAIFFYLKIRRRTLYYGFNMILPSLVISMMTLLGFVLPVESGEKITMEITILLSVCVFSTMIANIVPPTSEAVPLIGTFFTCHMFAVAASVVLNVGVLNLYYRSGREDVSMPNWARSILLRWLPWLMMMQRPGQEPLKRRLVFASCAWSSCTKRSSGSPGAHRFRSSLDDITTYSTEKSHPANSHRKGSSCSSNSGVWLRQSSPQPPPPPPTQPPRTSTTNPYGSSSPKLAGGGEMVNRSPRFSNSPGHLINCSSTIRSAASSTSPLLAETSVAALLLVLREIQAAIEYLINRTESKDDIEQARNDWRYAAAVVDRLCFFVFGFFIVMTTCGVLFSAPHLVA